MRKFILLILLFASSILHAQDSPKVDFSLYTATFGEHMADYVMMRNCIDKHICHESVFPKIIWSHQAAFIGAEGAMSAGQILISRSLEHHHHYKIARIWNISNVVAFGAIDIYVAALQPASHKEITVQTPNMPVIPKPY